MRVAIFVSAMLGVMLSAMPAQAALLHPMFADHAVLQRGRSIPVYGSAKPGAAVRIEIGGQSVLAVANRSGQWSATMPALAAGGPYNLTATSGSEKQTVQDVLVGDVFLCTGQSNMQLSVRRAQNADAEIAAATDGSVRELAVDRVASAVPLEGFTTPVSWKVETPQTAGDFSASCFFFAREMRKIQNVPVGLITAAWGGTRDRGWVSHPTLRKLGFFHDDLDMLALYQRDRVAASKRWDAAWETWWRANGQGTPWKEDTTSWSLAPRELGPWGDWPGLRLPDGAAEAGVGFVGQLWLTTQVTLTAAQAARSATLVLGKATEEEKSWVNGTGVGGSSLDPDARHVVPRGLLRAGPNTVTLNIFCSWRNCGLSGPASTRYLQLDDGSKIMLDQPWRYKPVERIIAPQIPWGPMHGIGLQYNGMIAPIGVYGVKAAIWYQGESNLYFARTYQAVVGAMMRDWRQQFGAALPFMIVQIPNYGPVPTQPTESLWSDVREAQRRIVEADPGSALVVTFDIGDAKNLHPPNKQEIGRRLAIAARHIVYGDPMPPSGARVADARRNGDVVTVSFRDVTGSLAAFNGAPNAFELCDAKGCHWAPAQLAGNSVTLTGRGDRVRYCWGDSPICTLTDGSGLPAGPFELPVR